MYNGLFCIRFENFIMNCRDNSKHSSCKFLSFQPNKKNDGIYGAMEKFFTTTKNIIIIIDCGMAKSAENSRAH